MSGISLPPGHYAPTRKMLKQHYGAHVSGILRGDSWPPQPTSWLVQHQMTTGEYVTRWQTVAVYKRRDAAEAFAHRMEGSRAALSALDPSTGEVTPSAVQPVSVWRAVSLWDVFEKGSIEALGLVLIDLMQSDHEWLLSTEIGSPQKIELTRRIVVDDEGGR